MFCSPRRARWSSSFSIGLLAACGSTATVAPNSSPNVDAAATPIAVTVETELSESIRAYCRARERGAVDEDALMRIRRACDTEGEWRQVVEGLDVIHMRSKWPKGEPLRAWIRGCDWVTPAWRVTAVPVHARLREISASSPDSTCGNAAMWDIAQHRMLPVGDPFDGLTFIDWDVTIDLATDDGFMPTVPAWSGRIRSPIELVASIDDVIPVVRLPALDLVVRNTVSVSRVRGDPRPPYEVWLCATDPDFTTGLSAIVELRRAEDVVEVVSVPVRRSDPRYAPVEGARADLTHLPYDMTPARADAERWTLRVIGTNAGLLDSWEVERAWGGEFTMPLSEAMTLHDFPK